MGLGARRAPALARPSAAVGRADAGNVAAGIAAVDPWGVDVASGTESAPGVKDAEKLAAFLAAVAAASGGSPEPAVPACGGAGAPTTGSGDAAASAAASTRAVPPAATTQAEATPAVTIQAEAAPR